MAVSVENDPQARLKLLYELSCAFAAKTDLADLIPFVIERCREVLGAAGASVLMVDAESNELFFPYVAEQDPETVARLTTTRFPADRGISGEVLRTQRPLRIDDAHSDSRFYDGVDRRTGFVTGPLLAAPFSLHGGPMGVLQAVRPFGEANFTDEDLEFLAALAGGVAVAIQNAQTYGRLREAEEGLRAALGAYQRDAMQRTGFPEIIARSAAMTEVLQLMESAAASPISVLIQGETGTGKELVARGIHDASARSSGPFVAVNCAALSESLLESELFGHRRGSFTGALDNRKGLFEAAAGGTILLDEVGEMPPTMQVKLLRVLQDGEIVPVGESRSRRVNVRVLSATNRDLEAEVAAGTMRADLYYRLAAFPIRVPPLRERREDIPLLASHFLRGAAKHHERSAPAIDPTAMDLLTIADWPGNVRQLRNEIERAVALTREGEAVGTRHLSEQTRARGGTPATSAAAAASAGAAESAGFSRVAPLPSASATVGSETYVSDLRAARATFEARHIAEVLGHTGGNVSQAARSLGLSRAMLQKKMKDYGLR